MQTTTHAKRGRPSATHAPHKTDPVRTRNNPSTAIDPTPGCSLVRGNEEVTRAERYLSGSGQTLASAVPEKNPFAVTVDEQNRRSLLSGEYDRRLASHLARRPVHNKYLHCQMRRASDWVGESPAERLACEDLAFASEQEASAFEDTYVHPECLVRLNPLFQFIVISVAKSEHAGALDVYRALRLTGTDYALTSALLRWNWSSFTPVFVGTGLDTGRPEFARNLCCSDNATVTEGKKGSRSSFPSPLLESMCKENMIQITVSALAVEIPRRSILVVSDRFQVAAICPALQDFPSYLIALNSDTTGHPKQHNRAPSVVGLESLSVPARPPPPSVTRELLMGHRRQSSQTHIHPYENSKRKLKVKRRGGASNLSDQ